MQRTDGRRVLGDIVVEMAAIGGDVSVAVTTVTMDADATSASPSPHLQPGIVVGRYEVGRLLGEGGMGVVYQARDPYLSRDVALKLITLEPGSERAELRHAR